MVDHEAAQPHSARVLLVEDDVPVAQMYQLKLELDGYVVDVAGDGVSALEKARRTGPDVIVLDIRLPKLDGLGVLEALRADPTTQNVRVHTMVAGSQAGRLVRLYGEVRSALGIL